MRNNLRIYDAITEIPGIESLTVPIVGVDRKNGIIIYSYSGNNVLHEIRGQDENEALNTIRNGLMAQLEFSKKLTSYKDLFKVPIVKRQSISDNYIFETQEPLKNTLSDMLSILAPQMPKNEKRNMLKDFKTGNEEKFVTPIDPRTVNTVVDDSGDIRICDIDGLTFGSMHHLLFGYLSRIGKLQHHEEELVDTAFQKLFAEKGQMPSKESREKFIARYRLQKPVENLVQAERHIRRTKRDAFKESGENIEKLETMANLFFNRAMRDLEKIGMSKSANAIISNLDRELPLKFLSENEHISLEAKLNLNEHDYASMMLRDKVMRVESNMRYLPEPEPLMDRVWNGIKWPVMIATGFAVFLTLASYLPKGNSVNVSSMLSNPAVASRVHERILSGDFDHCRMLGKFDECDEEEVKRQIAGYLREYMQSRRADELTITSEFYDQLFGFDTGTTIPRPLATGSNPIYNADTLALRMCMMNGLPPQFFRTAIHASISDKEFAEQARQEGYVGSLILLPMDTVRQILLTRNRDMYNEEYLEKMSQPEYWMDDRKGLEIAAIATQAMTSYLGKGNVSTLYARLFAGNENVDEAINLAKSDDFADFGIHLNPVAQELVKRAVAFHPFMIEDAYPMKDVRFSFNQDYSYEPAMERWIEENGL